MSNMLYIGPAAFRPRSHNASSYNPSIEQGRPVLQGLLAIDFLAKEVSFAKFDKSSNLFKVRCYHLSIY